jgi:pyrroloquinoline quinone (PQQ) biosynthesis protein C
MKSASVSEHELNKPPFYPETQQLVGKLTRIYENEELSYSLGAQFALETQADNMLIQLGEGFSIFGNSRNIALDKTFFQVHRTEEPNHFAAMRECIEVYEGVDALNVAKGARSCLDLFAEFWRRLADEV